MKLTERTFRRPREEACAAVLAGGEGRRLGKSKVLLTLEGRNLTLLLLEKLGNHFEEVLLVGKVDPDEEEKALYEEAAAYPWVRVVEDVIPRQGPLGGIHASLLHSSSPLVFVTACDMPFPSMPLIDALLSRAEGREAAVPRRGEYIEPLFAVYAKAVEGKAKAFLDKGELKVYRFISSLNVYFMDEREIARHDPRFLSFQNINSYEDLTSILRTTR